MEFSMELQAHPEVDQQRRRRPPTLTQPLGRHQEEQQRLTQWARTGQLSLVRGRTAPVDILEQAMPPGLDKSLGRREDTMPAMRDKVIMAQSTVSHGTPEHRITQRGITYQVRLIMVSEDLATAEQPQLRRR